VQLFLPLIADEAVMVLVPILPFHLNITQ
jgi:hypothetical protein